MFGIIIIIIQYFKKFSVCALHDVADQNDTPYSKLLLKWIFGAYIYSCAAPL
jgi:hypothetical protein